MKSISTWFWIIGSIFAGLLIFSTAIMQLHQTMKSSSEKETLEKFRSLQLQIDSLCWTTIGNQRKFELSFAEMVEGIYASETKHPSFSSEYLLEKINSNEISEGKYLCIKIKNKRVECIENSCNVSIPYLGATKENLPLQSLLDKILGRPIVFKYILLLNRTSFGVNISIT